MQKVFIIDVFWIYIHYIENCIFAYTTFPWTDETWKSFASDDSWGLNETSITREFEEQEEKAELAPIEHPGGSIISSVYGPRSVYKKAERPRQRTVYGGFMAAIIPCSRLREDICYAIHRRQRQPTSASHGFPKLEMKRAASSWIHSLGWWSFGYPKTEWPISLVSRSRKKHSVDV